MQSIIDSLETDVVAIERNICKLLKKKEVIGDVELLELLSQAADDAHKLASILRDCAIAAE